MTWQLVAAVALVLVIPLAAAQDKNESTVRKPINPWVNVYKKEFPFACLLVQLTGKNPTSSATGKCHPCMIMAPRFIGVHQTQLDASQWSDFHGNKHENFMVLAGAVNVTIKNDRVQELNTVPSVQTRMVKKLHRHSSRIPHVTSQFTLVEVDRGFQVHEGYVEFWPIIEVSHWPLGHDELCTGVSWQGVSNTFELRRMHFFMRRALECDFPEDRNFPLCVSGRVARRLCLAEPYSVIVTCQRGIVGFHSRYASEVSDREACTAKRNRDPQRVSPERIRAVAPLRDFLYKKIAGDDNLDLPVAETMWMPFRKPVNRPGGNVEEWRPGDHSAAPTPTTAPTTPPPPPPPPTATTTLICAAAATSVRGSTGKR